MPLLHRYRMECFDEAWQNSVNMSGYIFVSRCICVLHTSAHTQTFTSHFASPPCPVSRPHILSLSLPISLSFSLSLSLSPSHSLSLSLALPHILPLPLALSLSL